jgi:hypothetical protein
LFGDDPHLDVPRLANERDPEVCQVIDELVASWKISAERNFDFRERIPERDQAISERVDAEQIRVGEDFCPGGSFEWKGAGDSGLASGMAQIRLIFESRDWQRGEHGKKPTKL